MAVWGGRGRMSCFWGRRRPESDEVHARRSPPPSPPSQSSVQALGYSDSEVLIFSYRYVSRSGIFSQTYRKKGCGNEEITTPKCWCWRRGNRTRNLTCGKGKDAERDGRAERKHGLVWHNGRTPSSWNSYRQMQEKQEQIVKSAPPIPRLCVCACLCVQR